MLIGTSSRPAADAWEAHAESWAKRARTPAHDFHYEHFNLPQFLALLPAPGRLTVDLGSEQPMFRHRGALLFGDGPTARQSRGPEETP